MLLNTVGNVSMHETVDAVAESNVTCIILLGKLQGSLGRRDSIAACFESRTFFHNVNRRLWLPTIWPNVLNFISETPDRRQPYLPKLPSRRPRRESGSVRCGFTGKDASSVVDASRAPRINIWYDGHNAYAPGVIHREDLGYWPLSTCECLKRISKLMVFGACCRRNQTIRLKCCLKGLNFIFTFHMAKVNYFRTDAMLFNGLPSLWIQYTTTLFIALRHVQNAIVIIESNGEIFSM